MLVDVDARDVLGAEELGEPAGVAAEVAADLEGGGESVLRVTFGPEGAAALAGGRVAVYVLVSEVARPERFEPFGVA